MALLNLTKVFAVFCMVFVTSQVYAAPIEHVVLLHGLADFLVVHASHPFIMNDETVMAECVHFLRSGHFKNPKI